MLLQNSYIKLYHFSIQNEGNILWFARYRVLVGKGNKSKTIFKKLQLSLLPVAKYLIDKVNFIDKNPTRVAEKISIMANTFRKQHDKSTLIPALQQLIPVDLKKQLKFYVIQNSATAGIDQVVKDYLGERINYRV